MELDQDVIETSVKQGRGVPPSRMVTILENTKLQENVMRRLHRHPVLPTWRKEQRVKTPGRKLGRDNRGGQGCGVTKCVIQTFQVDHVDTLAKS